MYIFQKVMENFGKLSITLFFRNYVCKNYEYFSSMFQEREINISANSEMIFLV